MGAYLFYPQAHFVSFSDLICFSVPCDCKSRNPATYPNQKKSPSTSKLGKPQGSTSSVDPGHRPCQRDLKDRRNGRRGAGSAETPLVGTATGM